MTDLHVACAAEGEYVAHCGAMLRSLLTNGGVRAHVHFLHGPELATDDRERLETLVTGLGGELTPHAIRDEQVAGLPTVGFTRKATWYRILLPELLPGVDRVLYLDSDLLVLDSLIELAELDLAGNHLAAVTNVFQLDHLHWPERLGLAGPLAYFNAGVMLLDLAALRRVRATQELRAYGADHAHELALRDQDVVNVVLGRHRLALHPRWNCMNSVLRFPWSPYAFGAGAVAEARARPAIRHFEGPSVNKPWHYLGDRGDRAAYARHRAATPWPAVRIEGRTPANVLRRLTSARARERWDADRQAS